MKKLLLILFISASTLACAMQTAPKIDEWSAEMPDIWEYEMRNQFLKKDISKDQVISDVKQTYSSEELKEKLGGHGYNDHFLYFLVEDSKENIIKTLYNKPWFSAQHLRRPVLLIPTE